jgi:hypothetical protein
MSIDAYPLSWPFGKKREKNPQRSRFNVSFMTARDELMNEIYRMGGLFPVLSTNIPLKRDGMPYAGQKEPDDRGIAVYFTLKGQQFCFACDRWDKTGDNIQAIRHTISALRGIDRWGTGDMVQQAFNGFVALPPPDDPFYVLGIRRGASKEEINAAYKEKAKLFHPDLGGSQEDMQRINAARERVLS